MVCSRYLLACWHLWLLLRAAQGRQCAHGRCVRTEWERCGGHHGILGRCALGLTCTSVTGTGAAPAPQAGVCKVLPGHPGAAAEDESCPMVSGCDLMGGQCICDTRRSCGSKFMFPDMEACTKANKAERRRHSPEHRSERQKYVGPPDAACQFSGCNLTGDGCMCESQSCTHHFSYANRSQCEAAADELRCGGIVCPTPPPPSCPEDSALSKTYKPPDSCCPTLHPVCTCNFRTCPQPAACPAGQQPMLLKKAKGEPGDCCHVYECQKVSAKCTHNHKEFSHGEVYRMDACWLCRCRGGVSFCSKAECAKLDCENFYIPEGECCPVCLDVELLPMESSEASCWVNNKLRQHEEQWKEDDCTFCQCVYGEPHCTAMACKQSCQNPVRIPGECCPYCEEPTYETVSPLLCPPLENCSLSGADCPHGFLQDHNGCLLCQCLGNTSCPDLHERCTLQCPAGFKKDEFGCEVCKCKSPKVVDCRPASCSKTCPYGYVRNKHGCEMCRCVRCPPFTCDKHCPNGYQQNKKGCSVCLCKDSSQTQSTTAPVPPATHHCFTADGRRYEHGESWHDGCRECYCHGGHEMCVLISCPVPSCTHPAVRLGQCCPVCEDELGSGQPEGMDLVVCHAPGGEFYVEGETWHLDECTSCTCRKGRVLCDTEVCPPTLCQTPSRSKDTCCYVCPEDQYKPLLPVNTSQHEYCITAEGDILLPGDSWKADACTSCACRNGTIQCFSHHCPTASCRVPVLRKGQCCPHCLDTTSTTVPVTHLMTTLVPKVPIDKEWLVTTKLTTVIEDNVNSEDSPSQTEVVFIYQSAAWILAGLLLAIVIFLVVALLINKKKKWVQMSCYSAPKKMVILKKHVNAHSVVYMEPSKESKFQNARSDSFSPEGNAFYGERMSIPRAKLSTNTSQVLR